MEHFRLRNIVVCPPKSNWLIDRREKSKSRSMESFDLVALYDVDETVMRSGD
jgi:hypothetical protein